jgi:hypothetical protein
MALAREGIETLAASGPSIRSSGEPNEEVGMTTEANKPQESQQAGAQPVPQKPQMPAPASPAQPSAPLEAIAQGCPGSIRVVVFGYADINAAQKKASRTPNDHLLPGVRIDLIGTKYVSSLISNGKGEVLFSGLDAGSYEIAVVDEVPGYDLGRENRIDVEVVESQETLVEIGFVPEVVHLKCCTYFDPECAGNPADKRKISGAAIRLLSGEKTIECQTTGKDGWVDFEIFQAGLYAVRAPEIIKAGGCTYRLPFCRDIIVQVAPGQDCCEVAIPYCEGLGEIRVKAFVAQDSPAALPCIFALYRGFQSDTRPIDILRTDTGSAGAFQNLKEGMYTIMAVPILSDGFTQLYEPPRAAARVSLCCGQLIDLSNPPNQFCFKAFPAPKDVPLIDIEVVKADGTPFPFARVEILTHTKKLILTVVTDQSGKCLVPVDQKGVYFGRSLDSEELESRLLPVSVNSTVKFRVVVPGLASTSPVPATSSSGGSSGSPSAGASARGGRSGGNDTLGDLASYPILTEEVGYPPSPLASQSSTGSAGAGTAPLGQIVTKALNDVLGWKMRADDPKGFVGALTQSFTLTEVEGHVETKWTPRTYAVQTDLAGGITGAQASVYSRAKDFMDQSLPILDGLYALDPDSDPEFVKALKEITRSQMTELVNELGVLGGPRVSRVNQYFNLLIGWATSNPKLAPSGTTDPDGIIGTLGQLRDELAVQSASQFSNTVEDEQDVTNFRILSDNLTSLAQTWQNNYAFFGLGGTPFFGTQLVLLSRQLSVVAETVNEVRFALDSVFIGPSERQTLQLNLTNNPPMFLEDLLSWIQSFSTEEGPNLIQTGGKLGVGTGFVPVVNNLSSIVQEILTSNDATKNLPQGFLTKRVQRTLNDLGDQLAELSSLATAVATTKLQPMI